MRQPASHRVTRHTLASTTPAPQVRLDDPARQHRTIGLKSLPGDFKTELTEAAERGQVRATEGSVRHVEVFLVGSVRTPIIGRPRPLPSHRRAAARYTLNCEEPVCKAVELGGYFVSHAQGAFAVMEGAQPATAAEALLERLRVLGETQMTARDLLASSRSLWNMEDLRAALAVLQNHGWIHVANHPTHRPGRPRAPIVHLNPSIHTD